MATTKSTTKKTTGTRKAAAKAAPKKKAPAKTATAKTAARKGPAKAPARTAARKPAAKKAAAKPAAKAPAKTAAKAAAKPAAKAPAKAAAKAPASRPAKTAPGAPAKAPVKAAPKPAAKAPAGKRSRDFKIRDYIVYPAHGVGQVTGVEKEIIAGMDLEVYVIAFEQDKMTLRVPTARARATGMRPLASGRVVSEALTTLKGKARIKRTMWSRRAQEYEAKINSGDLISIAEVVRDLHRGDDQPEQSYSERQLYESALDRMVREVAAVEKIDRDKALEKLATSLKKVAA